MAKSQRGKGEPVSQRGGGKARRHRVVGHRRVLASTLHPHPDNWREHPEHQRAALRATIDEIGLARSLLAYEDPEWGLTLIDGHLRAEIDPLETVDVEIVDLTRDEARKLLAAADTLAGMAETDDEKLAALVAKIETESEEFRALLLDLAGEPGGEEEAVRLVPVDARKPPKMAWVLVGLPLVRYGEIADRIEAISQVDGIVIESVTNDVSA